MKRFRRKQKTTWTHDNKQMMESWLLLEKLLNDMRIQEMERTRPSTLSSANQQLQKETGSLVIEPGERQGEIARAVICDLVAHFTAA